LDIVAERIDLAIRHAPSVDGSLVISKLLKTHYRVVASQGYIEQYGRPQIPKEIEDHKGIFFSINAFQLPWKFKEKAHDHVLEFKPKAGLTISNALAVRKAALEGLGLALLADWTIDKDLKAGHLIDLFPEYEISASDFDSAAWIAYPSRAYVPARLRVFIDHLKGCV
jgi:DNA-binding transcriptional LysR family regulator